MHKEQNDQHSLEAGDAERYDGVKDAQIDEGDTGCSRSQRHKRKQDEQVYFGSDDVMFVFRRSGHDSSPFTTYFKGWRLMRYSSGKRKILTISTKCQYRPKLSMVEVCPLTYAPCHAW